MNNKKKAIFNWSGGKDSALALQKVLNGNEYEVVSLFTAIEEESKKSSVHSIPMEILSRQAKSIGIPLHTISFASNLSNYDEKMGEAVSYFKNQDVTHFIFGDIAISNAKEVREKKFNPLGIEIVEPLWDKTPEEVIDEFLKSGIKSKIVVTQADKLDNTFVGKELDSQLVSSFPDYVDVCGETGEYHSLAYAGELYKEEIVFSIGEIFKFSQDINLDNGQTKTFEYWKADIIA